MKENIGISALIVTAVAFMLHSGGSQPASTRAQAAKDQPASHQVTAEGPWLATRAFFHSPDNPEAPKTVDVSNPESVRNCAKAHGACADSVAEFFGVLPRKRAGIQFLIASVPDPLHSRVSLLTDSAIQAIQEGVDASDWVFASQWLPWIDQADPEEKDPEKRREEREDVREQEKQPGVLVYRSARHEGDHDHPFFDEDTLIVFLVGETPTSGINPAQFELARAYMRAIREPEEGVRILGPSFSGSFYGLTTLLLDDEKQQAVKLYKIRSGTATGIRDEKRFEDTFQRDSGGNCELDFRSATASTQDQDRYFRRAIDELGIQPSQAASIIEDESGFGRLATTTLVPDKNTRNSNVEPIRVYRFPRDISHLRNAYRDAVAASKDTAESAPPEVEFSIKDPAKGEDSIPIFSASQTPLTQYGVVNRIAESIREDGIRLVQISATNTLDMLFLAEFFRRECPDTRLLLSYPDVLLVQASANTPLTGTLVLATYPEFAAANGWMDHAQTHKPLTFPDANSEGVYNAAILLLDEPNSRESLAERLADYHWRTLQHPPSWLLTLDHRGFLPVDVFPHSPSDEVTETWFQKVPVKQSTRDGAKIDTDSNIRLPRTPTGWRVIDACLNFVCLGFAGWVFWISRHPRSERDARFSYDPVVDLEGNWRRFYLCVLLLILFATEATIAIPAVMAEMPTGFLVLSGISCAALILAVAVAAIRMTPRIGTALAVTAAIGSAAVFAALWSIACLSDNDRSRFFAFRARELRFGSSATWPVLAALAALALFAFVHLTRFYLAGCQDPGAVTAEIKTALQARMHDACEEFTKTLKSALCLRLKRNGEVLSGRLFLVLAFMFGVVGVAFLFRVEQEMRSIDGRIYDAVAITLQVVLIALLLITCANIRWLWESLQGFLAALAPLPVAAAFRPLDRAGADRPLWVRRLNLQSIDIHIRALYQLHNMRIALDEAGAQQPEVQSLEWVQTASKSYEERIRKLSEVTPARSRLETFQATQAIRQESASIASNLMTFLYTFWRKRVIQYPETAVDDEDDKRAGTEKEETPSALDRVGKLAESSVALHYSSFILYGVRQIQNLLVFLSSGFVLLLLSLNCYSVQAPRFVGRVLLVLFVIIGTSVISCLAGLERNPILSRIAGTGPGKLSSGFYLKIATYGALPAISLIASQFPSISNFLLSWVEPTLEAFK